MKLNLIDWYSIDIDVDAPPTNSPFCFLVQFDVALEGEDGATNFSFLAASRDHPNTSVAVSASEPIVVIPVFDWVLILKIIERTLLAVEQTTPQHWQSCLGKAFRWEYEGVDPIAH